MTYAYDANDRLLGEALDRNGDGTIDQTTTYGYAGTQQSRQEVRADGVLTSRTTFGYDLQGRLATVTAETFGAGGTRTLRERTTYAYDGKGIRVADEHAVDADGDGTAETGTRTEYLNDPQNATGYSQVLRATTTDLDTGAVQNSIAYTLGQDVLSQTTTEYSNRQPAASTTLVFGYDGHGSTRMLLDLAGAIATVTGVRQVFDYDAYGTLRNIAALQAATTLLYNGEWLDVRIGRQYLRARWYDPATGRFGSRDPVFGNLQDPQSLHKYLYGHADPINNADPTGLFSVGHLGISIVVGAVVGGIGGGVAARYNGTSVRDGIIGGAIIGGFAFGVAYGGLWAWSLGYQVGAVGGSFVSLATLYVAAFQHLPFGVEAAKHQKRLDYLRTIMRLANEVGDDLFLFEGGGIAAVRQKHPQWFAGGDFAPAPSLPGPFDGGNHWYDVSDALDYTLLYDRVGIFGVIIGMIPGNQGSHNSPYVPGLHIDRERWEFLDEANPIAALVHEAQHDLSRLGPILRDHGGPDDPVQRIEDQFKNYTDYLKLLRNPAQVSLWTKIVDEAKARHPDR